MMDTKEALKELEDLTVNYGNRNEEQIARLDEAIDMAIGALTAQPEKRTEERTETHACDLIDRQAAIEVIDAVFPVDPMKSEYAQGIACGAALAKTYVEQLPSAQPERLTDDDFETIRIHLNAYKEKLCNQHRWEEADEYQRIIDRFMAFASAQPDSKELSFTQKKLDTISRQAAIDHLKKRLYETALNNNTEHPYYEEIADNRVDIWLNELPSAQPEPCEDAVSREEAKWVVFCNRDHVEDQANAIDALPPVTPKAEQPDMSEYSDKLWKAAYERGKAEAQAEIVRCKDCKHRTSYWGNCRLLEEKYHQSVLVDGDSFCSMAERRTDD